MNKLLKDLVLGTVQFGLDYGISNLDGKTTPNEVKQILDYAWSQGLSSLDSASAYGNSEIVLGERMDHDFQIMTKFPYNMDINIIEKCFYESLYNLKREKIYGLLAHEADSIIKQPKIWDLLQLLKFKGIIEKVGVSLYYPQELEKLLSLGFFPDLIQVPLNILDKRFVQYFIELKSGGCEIHTRSAFLQGLFFLNPVHLSDFFNNLKPILLDIQKSFPKSEELTSFLIRTCLNTGIDKVVIGINNLKQLQNIALGLSVPTKQIELEFNTSNINEKIILPFNWPK